MQSQTERFDFITVAIYNYGTLTDPEAGVSWDEGHISFGAAGVSNTQLGEERSGVREGYYEYNYNGAYCPP